VGRVLAIDDEKAILEMLKRALDLFGFRVEVAASGEEGIEKFKKESFDVVVTDILMPGIDGVSVLNYIRKSNRAKTPVIGISGTPWLLQNENFDLILDKPFSIKALVESVRQFAENNKASDSDRAR
jgi:DNA-binding response OmpR family regulator